MTDYFSQQQLDRVTTKVKNLQADSDLLIKDIHGGDDHQFAPNPVLPLHEVEAFERIHNIQLPEGYREFLLQVGNGGLGPGLGILPLAEWKRAFQSVSEDFLTQPCPLFPGMNLNMRLNKLGLTTAEVYRGMITLVDEDFLDTYYGLIITGQARGHVIFIDMDRDPHPDFPPESNFLSWYERWLDEMIIYRQMKQALSDFINAHQPGKITERDALLKIPGYRYRVDLAYFSQDRVEQNTDNFINPEPPNLVVEISRSHYADQLVMKVVNFLAVGSTVWMVSPEHRDIAVCVPGKAVQMVKSDGVLDGGDVLPGFQLAVNKIFPESKP